MARWSSARTRSLSGYLFAGVIACALAGCEAIPGIGRQDAGAAPSPAAAAEELVYFAGEDGLEVYAEPSTRSSRVGQLALHDKVLRSEVSRGYARIRTPDDRIIGWVDNARLIWRLPEQAHSEPASAVAPSASAPSEPATAPPPAPAVTGQTPEPSIAPELTATPEAPATPETPAAVESPPAEPGDKHEPSVFNPF